jgi:flagellar motor switch protein FliN/FliY
LRSDDLQRILRVEVPVIVKLAECDMPVSRIIGLSPGAIIEFEKPAEDPLDLMINNQRIGSGQTVKVGENFGLRVFEIGTLQEKIAALGGR